MKNKPKLINNDKSASGHDNMIFSSIFKAIRTVETIMRKTFIIS